jgi:AraC-like DNA-binding protein
MMEDECYGLLSRPLPLGTFDMACELMLLSDTLGEGFERSIRFYALVSDEMAYSLTRDGDVVTFGLEVRAPAKRAHDFLREWTLLLWHRIACWLVDDEVPVIVTEFPHRAVAPLADYNDAFRSFCAFMRPSARMCIPARYLNRPIVRRLSDLESFRTRGLVEHKGDPILKQTVTSRVRAKLRGRLAQEGRLLALREVAEECGMSEQTLRRRLLEEGASYRTVKDEVRRDIALSCLADPALTIGETSLLAGFAEPNGLARAVRSWCGMSPSEYRLDMLKKHLRADEACAI